MANIVMVIARSFFRDEELFVTKNEFEKNGHNVTIASSKIGVCRGSEGGATVAEILLEDIDVKNIDALVFVGGSGTEEFFDSYKAHSLASEMKKSGKVLAAICIAPVLLARAGLLKGVNATVYPSGASDLKMYGANYTGDDVTVDRNIVTGNGPQSAFSFAHKVLELLSK